MGGVASGREARLAGADNGEGLIGREMWEGFFEGAREMELRGLEGDAEDGFAQAKGAVGGGFEGLCGGIVGGASDDNLYRMMGEERGG